MQQAYIKKFGKISLKHTEKYSNQILSLPIHRWLKNYHLKFSKFLIIKHKKQNQNYELLFLSIFFNFLIV